MSTNQAQNRANLLQAANKLLRLHGFTDDGQPMRHFSNKQKYFEKAAIIKTPMGNGMK